MIININVYIYVDKTWMYNNINVEKLKLQRCQCAVHRQQLLTIGNRPATRETQRKNYIYMHTSNAIYIEYVFLSAAVQVMVKAGGRSRHPGRRRRGDTRLLTY
jgi:hypothetical protein